MFFQNSQLKEITLRSVNSGEFQLFLFKEGMGM
jgi:hypothetical protein